MSECLRRMLRSASRAPDRDAYRWRLWWLALEMGHLDVIRLNGLIEGYRWGRWPRARLRYVR